MTRKNTFRKDLDIKEQECIDKLHAKRRDNYIFADTPFKCPYCTDGHSKEAFQEHYRYKARFLEHFLFWEHIMSSEYLVASELRSAIDAFIKTKSKSATTEAFKEAKANLIKEVERQHNLKHFKREIT